MTTSEASSASRDVFGRPWKGRRIAVIGLGKSGLAAARLLRRLGCHVVASDASDTSELRKAKASLEAIGVDEVELGGHTRRLIETAEALILSPGIPESTGCVQWALKRHLPILSEIELAFHFCPSPIIAVTGTNGKSTVVTLVTQLLKAAGRSAIACGNLGLPFAAVIDDLTPQTVAVVEVSSFQLLWCDAFRPKIGVLINVGVNHLDRHQDQQGYIAAKARLFQRQTPEDWAILNGSDTRVVSISERVHAQRIWFGDNRPNPAAFRLAPETRRAFSPSAQAILQVGRLFGIPDPFTWQVIRSFVGLEHRVEPVATVRGIHFVNDSKSTTPDSFLYALANTPGDVVVILGGQDKGLDFTGLIDPLHDERVKGVVLIGASRAKFRALLNGSLAIQECHTLEAAVDAATHLARAGTTVLFSPACASFDMFRNFEERGRVFKGLVHKLAQGAWGSGNGTRSQP